MKKFTFKDFISYNNPCFSCGEKIAFDVVSMTLGPGPSDLVQLRPTVTPELITIPLKITYNNSLYLQIHTQTNRVSYVDNKAIADYVYSHKLFLASRCDKCYTKIESQFIEFNLERGFVKPVGISRENLVVTDDTHMYHIYSSFISEQSTITMDRINKTSPISPIKIDAPLLPLYRFRDKEHFINKMKTYLIFT